MPVGLVRKWMLLGGLAAAVGTAGCNKDDDNDEPTTHDGGGGSDSGTHTDSGTGSDGGGGGSDAGHTDAGVDAGPPVMCGGKLCMPYSPAAGLTFAAGCAKNAADAEVCGISSSTIAPDGGIPPFLEKDAPGVASPQCGAFIDSHEPANDGGAADAGPDAAVLIGKGNGRIDTTVHALGMDLAITYPGCCTPQGFCSGDTNMGLLLGASASNGGFGCMESHAFFLPKLAASPGADMIPCDPDSGAIKIPSGDAGAGDAGAGDAGTDAGPHDASTDAGNG